MKVCQRECQRGCQKGCQKGHQKGCQKVCEKVRQKEPYKQNQTKSFRITKQQHKSWFLEASLVRQVEGKLKNATLLLGTSEYTFTSYMRFSGTYLLLCMYIIEMF